MDFFMDATLDIECDLFPEDEVIQEKEYRFKCTYCEYVSDYKHRVQKHESACHGVPMNKFFCKVCNKEYFQCSDLKLHEATHSGGMPYKCNLCNKRFKRKSSIKTHMGLFHMDDLPNDFIKCSHCDKIFKSKTFLRNHILKKHPTSSIKI